MEEVVYHNTGLLGNLTSAYYFCTERLYTDVGGGLLQLGIMSIYTWLWSRNGAFNVQITLYTSRRTQNHIKYTSSPLNIS